MNFRLIPVFAAYAALIAACVAFNVLGVVSTCILFFSAASFVLHESKKEKK